MGRKFNVYLSHSWHPRDVELNLWVWKRLAEGCDLLVDKPDSQIEKPPYYVNRLEETMRRSDIFVSILTFRRDPTGSNSHGDHRVQCSAASLFEIRLAERAHRPRLILYERTTSFHRPLTDWLGAKYIPFDRGGNSLPEGLDNLADDIDRWLEWVDSDRKPRFRPPLDRSLVLLPNSISSATIDQLKSALHQGLFSAVETIDFQSITDSELMGRIQNAGLVVADVIAEDTREVYAIAHALFRPTIRLVPDKNAQLPWILSGHPGGYQHDIVAMSDDLPWPREVTARASAIFAVTEPLSLAAGCRYIKSKRYKGFYVFLSHNLRPGKRDLLDVLIRFLREEQIDFFEYYRDNEAGIEWQPALDQALLRTTLFVALLADGYEDSPVCLKEWATARDRDVPILPFLVNGRMTRSNLTPLHNQTTVATDPEVNARTVFDQIRQAAI